MRRKVLIYSDILHNGIINIRSITYGQKGIWPWNYKRAKGIIRDCNILSDFLHNIPKRMISDAYDDGDIWFINWFPKNIYNTDGSCKYYGIGIPTLELYYSVPDDLKGKIEWIPSKTIIEHQRSIMNLHQLDAQQSD